MKKISGHEFSTSFAFSSQMEISVLQMRIFRGKDTVLTGKSCEFRCCDVGGERKKSDDG